MKRLSELSPPLADIERRLFGVSEGLLRAVEDGAVSGRIREAVMASPEWKERGAAEAGDYTARPGRKPAQLPPHLRDLIRRRVAATHAKFDAIPAAGQIVEVREIKTPRVGQLDWVMQVPLYVLLDAPAESAAIWHGWLVSGETDYATSWDFVLQEQDEPFDPEAGMVQVWNPVRLYLPMASRVVAQLRLERVQAVRSLAADFVIGEEPSEAVRPGRVAVRRTAAGPLAATGSPLGGEGDPRRRYQRIYHHAAEAVREPARLAIAELGAAVSPMGMLIRRLLLAAQDAGEALAPVPRVNIAMRSSGPQFSSKERDAHVFFRLDARVRSEGLDYLRDAMDKLLVHANYSAARSGLEEDLPAESVEAVDQDLSWRDLARLRVVSVKPDGGGQLLVIPGSQRITASIEVDGTMTDKVTVMPGGEPENLAWEAEGTVKLILFADEGRKLALPLYSQTQM